MKKYLFSFMLMALAVNLSCSKDSEDSAPVSKLAKISNVSLNYHSASKTVALSRDVESENATIKLKKGVSWINNLQLHGKNVSFEVEENTNTSEGHRFDTILIIVKDQRIGSICVTQARNPFSNTRLKWANSDALYRYDCLIASKNDGLGVTKMVYNLEKSTGGKDSYKNYPAFKFCIEMNHDPENNMEWYLPSTYELEALADASYSYKGTPIYIHNYWWSSSESSIRGSEAFNVYTGSIATRGSVSKSEEWWVVAYRNGKIEE